MANTLSEGGARAGAALRKHAGESASGASARVISSILSSGCLQVIGCRLGMRSGQPLLQPLPHIFTLVSYSRESGKCFRSAARCPALRCLISIKKHNHTKGSCLMYGRPFLDGVTWFYLIKAILVFILKRFYDNYLLCIWINGKCYGIQATVPRNGFS